MAEQIAELIVGKAATAFTALVEYVQPSFAEPQKRFGWVNPDFENADFQPNDRCKDEYAARESGEIAFEIVEFDHDWTEDEALATISRRGLLPAGYEEGIGYAKKFPKATLERPLLLLGSVALLGGFRSVAFLVKDDFGKCDLCTSRIVGGWNCRYRVLARRR